MEYCSAGRAERGLGFWIYCRLLRAQRGRRTMRTQTGPPVLVIYSFAAYFGAANRSLLQPQAIHPSKRRTLFSKILSRGVGYRTVLLKVYRYTAQRERLPISLLGDPGGWSAVWGRLGAAKTAVCAGLAPVAPQPAILDPARPFNLDLFHVLG